MQIILPDADITIVSLNSLSDLALDFIIVIHLFIDFFLCREANMSNVRMVRVSTVIHVGQNQCWARYFKKVISYSY